MKRFKFNKGTTFQQKVWIEIAKIPRGKVITYQELALKIGNPNCVRAVAGACGKNPYIPEIPCHRVVRKDGGLGGYSADGGVERKKTMLKNEGHKFVNGKIFF